MDGRRFDQLARLFATRGTRRAGLRVLAPDQARFPSDTLSTHQVQLPGVALLSRWGVLGKVAARAGKAGEPGE